MRLQCRFRRFSLASIFIFLCVPQVQAGRWDDLINEAKNAASRAMDVTVEEVNENEPSSSPQDEVEETVSPHKQPSGEFEAASNNEPASASAQPAPIAELKMGASNGDLEIIGLRLGMSPSQAEAALKAYKGDFKFRYEKKELHGNSRVHQSINVAHSKIANTEYVSRLFASNDGSTTYSPAKKGNWIVLNFAAPPSENKLIYIQRTTGYLDAGPTIKAYDDAFVNKYGDIYFSQGREKIIRLVSGEAIVDNENKRCFSSIGKSLGHAQNHTYDRSARTNSGCGLILASSYEPLGLDMPMVQKITMVLTDLDDMHVVTDGTRAFIEDNNQKIENEKLKESSKSDAAIF